MPDIDLAPLAARARNAQDHVVVVQEGAAGTETMGKILINDFLPPVLGPTNRLLYNLGGTPTGMDGAEQEGGQLRLPYTATPATPAAGGLKLYGTDFGPGAPAFLLPNGRVRVIQSDLGEFNIQRYVPVPGQSVLTGENSLQLAAFGGALGSIGQTFANLATSIPRIEVLQTTAAATAIAGLRTTSSNARFLRIGRSAGAPGGFLYRCMWSPATGVATPTHRGFCGLAQGGGASPSDVEPSTFIDIVGMGWDAADANIQFLHNDAAGVATKIDLGAGFPVPTVDREQVYEVQLYSPNDLAQSVSYRVIRYSTTDKTIAAEATGTVVANLPTTTLSPLCEMSVGGTSSVIGVAVMGILAAREY